MADDIYKKTPITTPSDEHVLLNALGGRLMSADLIDRTTNSDFGRTIDSALADAILPVRVMLNAKAGDGDAPPTLPTATATTGERFNLLPGGKPELGKPEIAFGTTPDGRVTIEGRVRGTCQQS